MKTKQRLKQALALCMAFVFVCLPSAVSFAESTVTSSEMIAENLPAETVTILSAEELPANVTYAEAAEQQFVERMYSEEPDLNTVVLRHADNSRTMIVENFPVKYTDANGRVQDKSLKIQRDTSASKAVYRTKANDIQTTFGGTLSDGIRLQHGDVNILLSPDSAANETARAASDPAAVLSDDAEHVIYAVSDTVAYDYSLTYMGFKEDIVVTEYTGQTDFSFILHTNGLHVSQVDGSWFLCDASETVRASIGDIIIFTADERNNAFGELTVETITADQEYRLTIHVDAAYLADEKTAYPIRIDPTIEVTTADGSGAIEDVTLNSTAVSAPTSGALYVGNRETYGKTRILMKFPWLDLDPVTSADNITAATVEIRDIMCESASMSISVHRFTGSSSWSESSSYWGTSSDWTKVGADSYIATAMDTKTISYSNGAALSTPHRYSFNVLSAVKQWKNNSASQAKGIIFKSNNLEGTTTYQKKTFASFNRASYQPSIKVTYNDGPSGGTAFVDIEESAVTLGVNNEITLAYSAFGEVSWSSSNTSIATVSGGVVTAKSTGTTTIQATSNLNSSVYDICTITVVVTSGLIYKIKNIGTYEESGGGYLTVDSTGAVYATSESNNLSEKASQLWYIEKTENGYTIESLGKKDTNSNGIYQLLLSIPDSHYIPSLRTNETVDTSKQWNITISGDGMQIVNVAYSAKKLYCDVSTGVNVSTVDNDLTRWQFEPVELDHYWDCGYSNGIDDSLHLYEPGDEDRLDVYVLVHNDALSVIDSSDFDAILCWNELSDRINITIEKGGSEDFWEEPPAGIDLFIEMQMGVSSDEKDLEYGRTVPYNPANSTSELIDLDQDWYHVVKIELYKSNTIHSDWHGILGLSSEWRQKVLIHEVGHALKLQHPEMSAGEGYQPLSIMGQGANGLEQGLAADRAVLRPTGFDKAVLHAKWG